MIRMIWKNIRTDRIVYATGFENDVQGNPLAKVWKNGILQNFTQNTGSMVRSSDTDWTVENSMASSVFASGNDVYVTGYEQLSRVVEGAFEFIARARLWKNGVMQNLANGNFNDVACSVFVLDDDVYVLVYEFSERSNQVILKVWKNGQVEITTEVTIQSSSEINPRSFSRIVNSIFVSNGVVYVAGRVSNQAKLWKNGEEENLDSGMCAQSVFVSGNDVYVAGYGSSGAKLWKNGKVENLTNGVSNANAFSVYVSGNDVYVAGHDGLGEGNAMLWKNGIVQDIPGTEDAILFRSVFIKGDEVYLAGFVWAVQEVEPGSGIIPVIYAKATLWKNGKKLKLDVGKNIDSQLCSVFVQ